MITNLRIEGVSKTYANGTRALDSVSLTVGRGLFGLLGPNGAGKSTLMRIIATLLEPDAGAVHLGTIDVLRQKQEVRKRLGYLPQEFGAYPHTTVLDMLNHLAVLKGIVNRGERREAVDSLLHRTNLYQLRRKYVTALSGGMRQRFGIAQALLGNPELLVVDEPTAGLDPGERNRFYDLLSELGENVVVILSTHIVQDVMELCAHMAIIDQGKVLFHGSPDEAVKGLAGRIWEKSISKTELNEYQDRYRVISSRLIAGQPLIHIYSAEHPGDGFVQANPDLEDVFFDHVRRPGDSRRNPGI